MINVLFSDEIRRKSPHVNGPEVVDGSFSNYDFLYIFLHPSVKVIIIIRKMKKALASITMHKRCTRLDTETHTHTHIVCFCYAFLEKTCYKLLADSYTSRENLINYSLSFFQTSFSKSYYCNVAVVGNLLTIDLLSTANVTNNRLFGE